MYQITGQIEKADGQTEKVIRVISAPSISSALDEFEQQVWTASSSRESLRTVAVKIENVQAKF